MQKILENYHLDNREEVIRYVSLNSEIMPLLEEAPGRIKQITQKENPLSLEVVYDPEGGEEMLFIIVWTDLPSRDLVEKELEIFDKWFIDATRGFPGEIGLSLRPGDLSDEITREKEEKCQGKTKKKP